MNRLEEYISQNGGKITMDMAYAISSLSILEAHSTLAAESVVKELRDQRQNLKLIASENYSSLSVQAAMGSLLTDKYSEGFPGHRFYAGCDNVDVIESAAVEKAKKIFGADHAYVQPHSGADANLCAYWAILNQKGPDFYVGGDGGEESFGSIQGRLEQNKGSHTQPEASWLGLLLRWTSYPWI